MPRPHGLPPAARLRLRDEIRRVVSRGQVYPGREALVRRVANDLGRPRLAIATPRAYGSSVRRNRFRRLVREAFRRLQDRLGGYDLLVSPRKHLETPTLDGLAADLLRTTTARPAPPRTGGPR